MSLQRQEMLRHQRRTHRIDCEIARHFGGVEVAPVLFRPLAVLVKVTACDKNEVERTCAPHRVSRRGNAGFIAQVERDVPFPVTGEPMDFGASLFQART